ncbi:MAG: hypothetical protein HC849_09840 [Oscillatoriales cyanobacterium RU_3_3]|nr:hypothetical protein [Microcoleus sp. SU_5_6]NJM60424.1 hypothetical protein [Oscillatoriales cyanobacterium RU_3_3]
MSAHLKKYRCLQSTVNCLKTSLYTIDYQRSGLARGSVPTNDRLSTINSPRSTID